MQDGCLLVALFVYSFPFFSFDGLSKFSAPPVQEPILFCTMHALRMLLSIAVASDVQESGF